MSVIVPVYCLGSMASECLRSLALQDPEFPCEFLIVDDASSDDSWERIRAAAKEDQRFRIWHNSRNHGLAWNQAFLLTHCRGEYIAYMDGDDIALGNKLSVLASHLDENPNCALVYHEAEVFEHGSRKVLYHYSRDHYNARYIPAVAGLSHLVKYGCFLNASSVMFRRHQHLADVVDQRCKILLDYPMHILNCGYINGTIDRIDLVLGAYRLHGNSACAMNAVSVERRIQVLNDQLCSIENAQRFGVDADVIAAGAAHHRFATALFFLKSGHDNLFRRFIEEASQDSVFFDDRQVLAFDERRSPDKVRGTLFGASA